MFMREFPVIDSALKETELEQDGEQFTPEFVYDAMKGLPRFVSMRVSDI
jgi:ubiquitin carboxyl-terminal hydrolase 10